MRDIRLLLLILLAFSPLVEAADCPVNLDYQLRPLGEEKRVHLCEEYRGKAVLIVNTASKCGYTNQYEGLEAMYDRLKDQGLVVLGFPSNDFGSQEPGTEKQIQSFCRLTYGVRFPMFEKTHASKAKADPLYRRLGELAGEYPQWNFHKYLLNREGELVGSFRSHISPSNPQLVKAIEDVL